MSLDSSRYRLWNGYQSLLAAWEAAQRHWRDPVAQEFDRKHLVPLGPSVFAALSAMDQLDQMLTRVRQECGDS